MCMALDELDVLMSDWNSDFMEANVLLTAPWIMVPSSSWIIDCISVRRRLRTLLCSVNDCSCSSGVMSRTVLGGGGGMP